MLVINHQSIAVPTPLLTLTRLRVDRAIITTCIVPEVIRVEARRRDADRDGCASSAAGTIHSAATVGVVVPTVLLRSIVHLSTQRLARGVDLARHSTAAGHLLADVVELDHAVAARVQVLRV